MKNFTSIKISLFIAFLFFLSFGTVTGQTPGLITTPASAPGNSVLDPNGDGYTSANTSGFISDDQIESEIPYRSLVFIKVEPNGDLYAGPNCGFTDFVDEGDEDPIQQYIDANGNWMFRMRMGKSSPNSKSYSILIDTDGLFGGSGPNRDPQFSSSNPGFEIEIVLATNFGVFVYDVNNAKCTPVISYLGTTNYQKSKALTNNCGDPDYFYDFFVKMSDLTTTFAAATPAPVTINASTPVRMAVVDNMAANKSTICNLSSASDVAGVDSSCGSLNNCLTDLIDNYTPCPAGQVCQDRTTCPAINGPIYTANTTITGTSTEVSGTLITVSVYASDGVTLLRTGTTTTTGTTWTINVSVLSPSGTLATGQIVRATAKAIGKGTSIDNCSEKTVLGAPCTIAAPTSITRTNGDKDMIVNYATLTGVVTINVYNADGSLWKTLTTGNVTSNQALLNNGTPTANGSKVPDGTYYATVTLQGCTSPRLEVCLGSYISNPPAVSSPLTAGETTISGTGQIGFNIIVYADGVQIATQNNLSTTNWSVTVPALTACQVITAKQNSISDVRTNNGFCNSAPSNSVTVTRIAATPTITTFSCVASPFAARGTSSENGATITLYQPNSAGTIVGTGTVIGGSWSIVPTVSSGTIVAKINGTSCVLTSADSAPVTYTRQSSTTAYTIGITAPTEGQSFVTGTISGGTYPVKITLYEDGSPIVNTSAVPYTVDVNAAGNWTVNGLSPNDLYVGGIIQISVSVGAGCESNLSATQVTVLCKTPILQTYTGGSQSYCSGRPGSIILNSSESGVIYELVNGAGTAVGPSAVGTGGPITLSTFALSANLLNIYVKAYKSSDNNCAITSTVPINFDTQRPSPTVTFSTTSLSVQQGTTSLNYPFSAKSSSPVADLYSIDYSIAANNQGFTDVTTAQAIPAAPGNIVLVIPASAAVGTYTATMTVSSSSGNSCVSIYNFSITIFSASSPPVISMQPASQSICSGSSTILSVTASSASTMSYQWQSSTAFGGVYGNVSGGSGATTATYTTPALTNTTYYRVLVTNSSGTTTSEVATVTVNAAAAQAISGISPLCSGTSTTWTSTNSGGSWSSGNTSVATVDSLTGLVTGASEGTSEITYSVTVGGCVNTANKTVAVTTRPAAPTASVTEQPTCTLATGTITVTAPANGSGVSYTVTGTSPVVAAQSNAAGTFSGLAAGNYNVTTTVGGCTSNTTALTVNAQPATPAA
ncbi:beta strand repeat-containing protein, partial [Flavobacterium sp. LS2P90]